MKEKILNILWYFVTEIVLAYCEKNCSSDWEKLLKFAAARPKNFKISEITRTIYSHSESSEQFLITECFSNLLLEVSQI